MVKILGNTDLSSNQLQFHVVHKGTSFPSSPAPVQGQLFFRTDENKLYFYDGSDWTAVGTGAGGGGVGTYLHTQSSPSTTWNVTHNLNDTRPVLEIYDNNGMAIEPVSITITDANSLVIEFGSEVTGTARVHGGIFAGGTGTGHFLPNANNTWDIGSETLKWRDGYFAGKLTVDGSVDPIDIRLTPQDSAPSAEKGKLYFDNVSNKMKICNDGSTFEDLQPITATGFNSLAENTNRQAIKIMLLEAASNAPSQDYDTIQADVFTRYNGFMNSVDYVGTTAQFMPTINEYCCKQQFVYDDFNDNSFDEDKWTKEEVVEADTNPNKNPTVYVTESDNMMKLYVSVSNGTDGGYIQRARAKLTCDNTFSKELRFETKRVSLVNDTGTPRKNWGEIRMEINGIVVFQNYVKFGTPGGGDPGDLGKPDFVSNTTYRFFWDGTNLNVFQNDSLISTLTINPPFIWFIQCRCHTEGMDGATAEIQLDNVYLDGCQSSVIRIKKRTTTAPLKSIFVTNEGTTPTGTNLKLDVLKYISGIFGEKSSSTDNIRAYNVIKIGDYYYTSGNRWLVKWDSNGNPVASVYWSNGYSSIVSDGTYIYWVGENSGVMYVRKYSLDLNYLSEGSYTAPANISIPSSNSVCRIGTNIYVAYRCSTSPWSTRCSKWSIAGATPSHVGVYSANSNDNASNIYTLHAVTDGTYIYVCGQDYGAPSGRHDIFMYKLNTSLQLVGSRTYYNVSANEDGYPNNCVFTNSNLYITGYYSGVLSYNMPLLIKVNTNLVKQWMTKETGEEFVGSSYYTSLEYDGSANLIVIGRTGLEKDVITTVKYTESTGEKVRTANLNYLYSSNQEAYGMYKESPTSYILAGYGRNIFDSHEKAFLASLDSDLNLGLVYTTIASDKDFNTEINVDGQNLTSFAFNIKLNTIGGDKTPTIKGYSTIYWV